MAQRNNGQLIEGHRPGVRFHLESGEFTNGGPANDKQVRELTAAGYKLRNAGRAEIVEEPSEPAVAEAFFGAE